MCRELSHQLFGRLRGFMSDIAIRFRWMRVRMAHSIVGAIVVGALALGCGDQSLAPPALPADKNLYWELALNHSAVLMSATAPYDKLQLTAIPLNYFKEPLATAPVVTFLSTNPENVFVTDDGKIIALHPVNTPVTIVASATVNNVKRSRDVPVMVLDTAQPMVLNTFSIHPVFPESTKVAVSSSAQSVLAPIPLHVVDANGVEVLVYGVYGRSASGILPVDFESEDPTIVATRAATRTELFEHGFVMGRRRGSARVFASTTVFGTVKADTVTYRIGWPTFASSSIDLGDPRSLTPATGYYLLQPSATIGTGGVLYWQMIQADSARIEFADSDLPNVRATAPVVADLIELYGVGRVQFICTPTYDCTTAPGLLESGNVFLVGEGDYSRHIRSRYFPVPGTYDYTVTFPGTSSPPVRGRINVVDENAVP